MDHQLYSAAAALIGCRQSGFGRETHKIILEHLSTNQEPLVS
jgi:hypothetical protein